MAAIFECTEERYALNLNPYQIFVFLSEKTKPYLELFKEFQKKSKSYEIILLPFEPSEAQQIEDDSVDPQLYNIITHADVVARVVPEKFGDYRYLTETFLKRKSPDFDYMSHKWHQFMDKLRARKTQNYVHTIRRFFQYGNQEFCDFVMSVFNGNLNDLMEMSDLYSHMVGTGDYQRAQDFTRQFIKNLMIPRENSWTLLSRMPLTTIVLKSPRRCSRILSIPIMGQKKGKHRLLKERKT